MKLQAVTIGASLYLGLSLHKSAYQQPVSARSWFPWGSSPPKSSPQAPDPSKFRDLPPLTLYQFATCPFCNKVTAYLDYFGIAYDLVEVHARKKTEIKWKEGKKKVPTIKLNLGESEIVLDESSKIISLLQSYRISASGESLQDLKSHYDSIVPEDKKEDQTPMYTIKDSPVDEKALTFSKEELKWRKWADEHLVHALAPNIYRNYNEALDSFRIITEKGNFEARTGRFYVICTQIFGATFMYFMGKRLKRKYLEKSDPRECLFDMVDDWVEEVGQKKFHGGERPDLADLAVYGVLKSIEDMETFYDMVRTTDIGPWYGRMARACMNNSKKRVTNPKNDAALKINQKAVISAS